MINVTSSPFHTRYRGTPPTFETLPEGCVANVGGRCDEAGAAWSEELLGGQRIELFSRIVALVSGLNDHLFFPHSIEFSGKHLDLLYLSA